MNFYSITLDINDRREFQLELFPQGKQHRLQKPKTFVIDFPGFGVVRIASILRSSVVKSFVQNGEDLLLSECTAEVSRQASKVFVRLKPLERQEPVEEQPQKQEQEDISFEDIESYVEYGKSKPKPEEPKIEYKEQICDLGKIDADVNLRFTENNHSFKLEAILPQNLGDDQPEDANLEIIYQFDPGTGEVYENSIVVNLSHPANFLGIALDFGSESSQMAVKRYDSVPPYHPQTADNENLFRNIVAYHKNQGWIARDTTYDFYQEEKGTNFYKSLFFLREQLSGEYKNIDSEPFIRNPQENLKMLLNMDDGFTTLGEQKFYQLPNLKILHKHERLLEDFVFEIEKDGYPINLKLRDIKQKVYNTILEVMIASFLKKEFIRYENARRNIRMMLLVPNNYDVKDINKTQHHLNMIFEALSKSEEYKGKIGAWEILTLSESDASFIGYLNKNNVEISNNKDYIIIDSGKGTTDFSVIRTGSKSVYNLNPIYRNGFTGAGNMITYAVFETVMHFIREHSPEHGADVMYLRNKIIGVLKDNDLVRRNDLYNQIERLKFNYRDKSEEASLRQSWLQAYDGQVGFRNIVAGNHDIDALVKILSKVSGITDFYGYIGEACKFIVNSVVDYLKVIKENKKDLSFAGVVLTGRAFRFQPLSNLMREKLHNELNIPLDKIRLLQGNELKDICINGVFNNSIKLNAELTGYPIQLVYRMPQSTQDHLEDQAEKVSLSKRIFRFFINDAAEMTKVEEMRTIEDEVEFSLLQRSQFLIGCKRYAIRNEEFLSSLAGHRYTASIDFTQRGYVIRRKLNGKVNYISALEEIDDGGAGDKSLVVPSLFPNYIDEEYMQSLRATVQKKMNTPNNPSGANDFYPPYYTPEISKNNNSSNNNNNNPLFF